MRQMQIVISYGTINREGGATGVAHHLFSGSAMEAGEDEAVGDLLLEGGRRSEQHWVGGHGNIGLCALGPLPAVNAVVSNGSDEPGALSVGVGTEGEGMAVAGVLLEAHLAHGCQPDRGGCSCQAFVKAIRVGKPDCPAGEELDWQAPRSNLVDGHRRRASASLLHDSGRLWAGCKVKRSDGIVPLAGAPGLADALVGRGANPVIEADGAVEHDLHLGPVAGKFRLETILIVGHAVDVG